MFVEAQRDGVIPLHHNPAIIARTPRRIVKTGRLLINEWRLIFEYAKYRAPEYFFKLNATSFSYWTTH